MSIEHETQPAVYSFPYMQLCLTLNLSRTFRNGDWWGLYAANPNPEIWHEEAVSQPSKTGRDGIVVVFWLPRLTDWLEMLEEAGYRAVATCRKTGLGRSDECWAESHRLLSGGLFGEEFHADGATREEAVARLWMAVTKK